MKTKYLAIFCLTLIVLTIGAVSAEDAGKFATDDLADASVSVVDDGVNDDAVLSDSADDYVLGSVDVDGDADSAAVDAVLSDSADDYVLGSVDVDGDADSAAVDVVGANDYFSRTHIEINSYNLLDNQPHSINIYNDSDYVARIYAPYSSTGEVSLSINRDGDFNEFYEIFTADIRSLEYEVDMGNIYYSYFYIRPGDIFENIIPNFYHVLVEYKFGYSLSESANDYVRFVDNSDHVIVDAPSEIVIGDWENDHINIYVEGTKGYLRVLIDGVEVINDSVFNLRYGNDLDTPKNYITVFLDDLSIGQHTYKVSYYDGNWDNVTIEDVINVTYLFDVIADIDNDIFYGDDYVYYGDNVSFLITLPYDVRSKQIKVNGEIYNIDLTGGFTNLTLSGFDLGNNTLVFTYDDVYYGEKSVNYILPVGPKLYVPETVAYGNGDELIFKLPADAYGTLDIYNVTGGNFELIDSLDVIGGEATYSFDSWDLGFYELFLEYEDSNYYVSKDAFVIIVPNVIYDNETYIGENVSLSVNIPRVSGSIKVTVNGEELVIEEIVDGKINVTIPSTALHLGMNNFTLSYDGDDLTADPFTYDLGFDEPMPIEYELWVVPNDLDIPLVLSEDGQGNILLELPEGSGGNVDVYVNHDQLSSTPVSGGENYIPLSITNMGENVVTVVYTDEYGFEYNLSSTVYVKKPVDQFDIEFLDSTSVLGFTAYMPADVTGVLYVIVEDVIYPVNIVDGKANFSLSNLPNGTYIVGIEYPGNDIYEGFSSGLFADITEGTVLALPRTVIVNHTGAGDAADIQAAIDAANPGDIVLLGDYDYVDVAGVNITKPITIAGVDGTTISSSGDGTPIFNVPAISAGGPESANITGVSFKLNNRDVVVKVTADNDTSPYSIVTPSISIVGNTFDIANETVVPESIVVMLLESERGVLSPTGEISIRGNTITAGVPPFEFVVIGTISGGDAYVGPQNFSSEKRATVIEYSDMNTTAVSPLEPRTGEWFVWRLLDDKANPLANTPMQIGFNGVIYDEKNGMVTDENGYAKLQINLGYKGDYTFAICFLGNEAYNASFVVAKIKVATQTGTLTVPNKSYKATAKTKALTATFKTAKGSAIANKKITFTVNGKTYSAKTNDKGIATVNVSLNKKGTYSFTAKFAGDSTYAAVKKTAVLKIT